MAPAPKPLPRLNPQHVSPTQATKQQTQQRQQLAHHLHEELVKPNPHLKTCDPHRDSYDERDGRACISLKSPNILSRQKDRQKVRYRVKSVGFR
jgi:hypothetical protein